MCTAKLSDALSQCDVMHVEGCVIGHTLRCKTSIRVGGDEGCLMCGSSRQHRGSCGSLGGDRAHRRLCAPSCPHWPLQ
eukprot:2990234-Rhodomonas_salina.1